jgi:hypothetical protein
MATPNAEILENAYCSPPGQAQDADVVVVGSGIGLAAVQHFAQHLQQHSIPLPKIAVLDAGPFDLPCHLGDLPGFNRFPFIQQPERLGGKLSIWGVSIPWPRDDRLALYPYSVAELRRRFVAAATEMGGPEPIPKSGKDLELTLLNALRDEFYDGVVSIAPLAIDGHGTRWTPLKYVPRLVEAGVKLVTRFRVSGLERVGRRITAVRGCWGPDGIEYTFRPRAVVVAIGVERSLPLLSSTLGWDGDRPISDHHRVDFNAILPPDHFGARPVEQQGVAVLIVELTDDVDGGNTPLHLEVKCAPLRLWRDGYMQSSDNLNGSHSDDTLYAQIQAVGAMKDTLPRCEFVNARGIRPAMSLRDARFQARIVQQMERVCYALRVPEPSVFFRPVTQNHHLYRACTVGFEVDHTFRSVDVPNLIILPPTAFFDHHCDANPTLKSVVVSQYAMEDLANRFKQEAEAAAITDPTFDASVS